MVNQLDFLWKGVPMPITLAKNHYGPYAIVSGSQWNEVHPDDYCTLAIEIIEHLGRNGYELSGDWNGYLDSECLPVFWLKGENS